MRAQYSLALESGKLRGEGSVLTACTLCELCIYCVENYSSAINFITSLSNASLAEITLSAYGSIAHLIKFLLALSRRRPVAVLRELDLRLLCNRDSGIAPALTFQDHVSSLLFFSNLVHLHRNYCTAFHDR